MKFYLVALTLCCLNFISCRKDRTCNCSIVTNGSNATRNQTAGTSITIPGLPPVVLVPPSDTTVITPYSFASTQKTNYNKVSKNTMNGNCPATLEENFNDLSSIVTPGTSTVTNQKSEKRTYTCKIE